MTVWVDADSLSYQPLPGPFGDDTFSLPRPFSGDAVARKCVTKQPTRPTRRRVSAPPVTADGGESPLEAARRLFQKGDYGASLAQLRMDSTASLTRRWTLAMEIARSAPADVAEEARSYANTLTS
jgi:hypothetical protein